MIDAVSLGALTIEKLEAMTCVCSVGLDMIAIPGDTPSTTIAGIIADEAAIGMVNQKTTCSPPDPSDWKESRRYSRIWRPFGLCTDHSLLIHSPVRNLLQEEDGSGSDPQL